MALLNRTLIILSILFFYIGNNIAHAQLWRYLNDSPEKRKAADKELKKEAFSVVTKKTISYGDTFSYDIMTHVIKSFDGQQVKINLWEKPFDGHVFHIDLSSDKLTIPDFSGLAKVHHLSNELLEIVYSPRGGSNDGYDNVLILGVNKNKFCIVAEIQSVHEFDGPNGYGFYDLHLQLKGSNTDSYQMPIKVRELLKSGNKTKKSYDRTSNFLLKFDKSQHVFYTDNQKMDAYIYLEDVTAKKHHVTGFYSMISLGEYKYCFINKTWYSVEKDTAGKTSLFAQPTESKSP